jgi:hypothetical protein
LSQRADIGPLVISCVETSGCGLKTVTWLVVTLPAVAEGMHHIDDALQTESCYGHPYKVVRIALSDERVRVTLGVCS